MDHCIILNLVKLNAVFYKKCSGLSLEKKSCIKIEPKNTDKIKLKKYKPKMKRINNPLTEHRCLRTAHTCGCMFPQHRFYYIVWK